MKNKLRLSLFSLIIVLVTSISTNAQYYSLSVLYQPGNPKGLNTDVDFSTSALGSLPSGSTKIVGNSFNPLYSASQTIPFSFKFNGGTVTSFKASTSGYITFAKITPVAGNTPAALPSGLLPDSTVCVWGLCTAGLYGTGCVYTKLWGTAPNRQLWISWYAATNPSDTGALNFWSIALEEGTNNIYVVDQSGGYSLSGSYVAPGLTIGIQVNSSTAYEIAGSPGINAKANSPANTDNDYYEFSPGTIPSYDAGVVATNIDNSMIYGVGNSYSITAYVTNFGSVNLTSLNLNWMVTGGTDQADVVACSINSDPASVNFQALNNGTEWSPATAGTYTLKIWANELNGSNTDQNHSNDTLTVSNIQVVSSLYTKVPLLEEFNQASCDPCAEATPTVDTALSQTRNICSAIRYHVNWPGRDFMNQETNTPFVGARVSYYGVDEVPDSKLDGSTDIYPFNLNATDIENAATVGSPFQITINTCTYDRWSNLYSFSAQIKSAATLSAGLVAHVVLTVDTINYADNQSTESIAQYLFPQVAEEMFTSASGTTLGAFTPNSTQTVTASWTKNRPWGASPKSWKYDSTYVGHIVIFIQDNNTQYVYQSANAPTTDAVTSVQQLVTGGEYMEIHPNPSNGNAYVAYNISESQNVSIEVYNMLGEKVCSINQGKMDAGGHVATIEGSSLQNGVYFVRLSTNNNATTKRLIIQK